MNEIESEIREEILKRLRTGRQIVPGCLNIKTNRHADEAVLRRMIEDKTLVREPNGKFAIRTVSLPRSA